MWIVGAGVMLAIAFFFPAFFLFGMSVAMLFSIPWWAWAGVLGLGLFVYCAEKLRNWLYKHGYNV